MAVLTLLTGAGLVAAGGLYLLPHFARPFQNRRLQALCRLRRTLVLTYDDGPGPELTPRVLDLLGEANAQATFFLLGMRAQKSPDLVERTVAAGHEVACHSYFHRNAWKTWPWKATADVSAGYDGLARWVSDNALFRPPYGKLTLPVSLALLRRHARVGWWTVDSGDTHSSCPAVEEVEQAVRRQGGAVVLLHDFDREGPDAVSRAGFVCRTTRQLLQMARRESFAVKTLGDLLEGGEE